MPKDKFFPHEVDIPVQPTEPDDADVQPAIPDDEQSPEETQGITP